MADVQVTVGGAEDGGLGRSAAMELRAKLKGLVLLHFSLRASRIQNPSFLPFSFHLNFKLQPNPPSSLKHKFLHFFKVKQWDKIKNKQKKKKKSIDRRTLLAPLSKKLYWNGRRIRTIWLWILLALVLISCYILVQVILSVRTAFALKFIYKACKYAATSPGLVQNLYEGIRSLVLYN